MMRPAAALVSRRAVLNAGMTGALCASELRPRVAFAQQRAVGTLDPAIQARLAQKDELDAGLVRQESLKAVEKAFPYLKGNITSDALLSELDYIRVMYDKLPLSPQRRLHIRNKVRYFIENEQLSQETIDGLIKLMEAYGAL